MTHAMAKTHSNASLLLVTPDRQLNAAPRLADLAPAGVDRVFLVNSGSEASCTAMKIALAQPLWF